jgi:hypothetical protein
MKKTGVVKEVLGFAHGKSPLRFSRYLRSPLQVVSKSGDVSNRHKKNPL